jgi:hypothetical protein
MEVPLSAFVIITGLFLGFVIIDFSVLCECSVWDGVCVVSVVYDIGFVL